jgi:hypothetical protein
MVAEKSGTTLTVWKYEHEVLAFTKRKIIKQPEMMNTFPSNPRIPLMGLSSQKLYAFTSSFLIIMLNSCAIISSISLPTLS